MGKLYNLTPRQLKAVLASTNPTARIQDTIEKFYENIDDWIEKDRIIKNTAILFAIEEKIKENSKYNNSRYELRAKENFKLESIEGNGFTVLQGRMRDTTTSTHSLDDHSTLYDLVKNIDCFVFANNKLLLHPDFKLHKELHAYEEPYVNLKIQEGADKIHPRYGEEIKFLLYPWNPIVQYHHENGHVEEMKADNSEQVKLAKEAIIKAFVPLEHKILI